MATFGHVAVGMAAARAYLDALGSRSSATGDAPVPADSFGTAALLFAALSMLPDADIVAFALGIPYWATWGHRGASHSLVFGLVFGGVLAARWACERTAAGRSASVPWAALLGGLAMASHGLLDCLTDGGLGSALFWPFTSARTFAPWRPVPVAPLGIAFISAQGLRCVLLEILLFAPVWLWSLRPRAALAPSTLPGASR